MRLVKEAAQRAGFDGTLHLVCYGRDRTTKADVGSKYQLEGEFTPPNGIRLYDFGGHAAGHKYQRTDEQMFKVFLHELGHFRRHIKGLPQGEGTKHERQAEQYANRYAEKEFKALWKQLK